MGGSVFNDLRSWTNAGRPAPFERFGVGDDLTDARPHAAVVARDQIFHIRRRRHFRRRRLQRGASLGDVDHDRIFQDNPDKRSAVLVERAELERHRALTEGICRGGAHYESGDSPDRSGHTDLLSRF